jgi:SnoaL-like domain
MSEGQSVSSVIDDLFAKQSIYECIVRAALGIDRRDQESIEAAFWPDAQLAYGTYSGPLPEFVSYLMKAILTFTATTHAITNVLVELNGSKARSQAYFNAYHAFPTSPPVTVVGRYLDNHERRAGEWRIAHRMFVLDWHAGGKSEDDFPIRASLRFKGDRKPNDPWYQMGPRG